MSLGTGMLVPEFIEGPRFCLSLPIHRQGEVGRGIAFLLGHQLTAGRRRGSEMNAVAPIFSLGVPGCG